MRSSRFTIIPTQTPEALDYITRFNAKATEDKPFTPQGSHVLAFFGEDNLPVALASGSMPMPHHLDIHFLKVSPKNRGHGLGASFLNHIFDFMAQQSTAENHSHIGFSGFTELGRKHLLGKVNELEKQYPEIEVLFVQSC